MPSCKFCHQPITAGSVVHAECWKKESQKVMEIFCNKYCRWPRDSETEDELKGRCQDCALVWLLNLGM